MEKYIDITALGELLIDSIQSDNSDEVINNPGGAPANVLVMAQKLYKRTAIISKIGNDEFGRILADTVRANEINADGLIVSAQYPTTVAYVRLDSNGERSFRFSRDHTADVMLDKSELNVRLLSDSKIFHFGSLSMTCEPVRSATLEAIRIAKESGAYISYDPNYRKALWTSEEEAVKTMKSLISSADILKVSDEEAVLLTGESDYSRAIKVLLAYGPAFVFITLGKEGCLYATQTSDPVHVPGYTVNTIDTTGAGDTFTGCILSKLIEHEFNPTQEELYDIVLFANAAGALNTSKLGAIPAMPSLSEILRLMKQ